MNSVRSNQDTLLLRLPAEIRNRIWQFALGGKLIRPQYTTRRSNYPKLMLQPCERKNAFSLLRTCRQIYAETAVLPFTINRFSMTCYWTLLKSSKHFRKYQCSQIEKIQLEQSMYGLQERYRELVKSNLAERSLSTVLPGLRRIHIRAFPCSYYTGVTFGAFEAFLQSEVIPGMLAKGYQVSIEEMNITAEEFDKQ
jgi:hypothetical protein